MFLRNPKTKVEDYRQIERAREAIRSFEMKYGMSSKDFVERWLTGTEPLPVEAADANLWVTHYSLVGKAGTNVR